MNVYSTVRELLSYFCTYAPAFPEEDQTNQESEAQKIGRALELALSITKNPDMRRWIELSIREFAVALTKYGKGEVEAGYEAVGNAERYFENVTSGKKHVVNFIVEPDGEVRPTGQTEGGIGSSPRA